MNRRRFLATVFAASVTPSLTRAQGPRHRKILLRSSWQTVNIGDIAHTPGMLALLEKHKPDAEVTLWPNPLGAELEEVRAYPSGDVTVVFITNKRFEIHYE